jgi:HSP20 family protein
MSLVRWNPAKELQDMQKRFDAFFGQEFPLSSHEQMARTEWSPAVDIAETPEGYAIHAEIPGVKKEDVRLTLKDGVLNLSGERHFEREEKNKKFHRVERSYGRFERSFTLPLAVDDNKISAAYNNGVLDVMVPKSSTTKITEKEIRIG